MAKGRLIWILSHILANSPLKEREVLYLRFKIKSGILEWYIYFKTKQTLERNIPFSFYFGFVKDYNHISTSQQVRFSFVTLQQFMYNFTEL